MIVDAGIKYQIIIKLSISATKNTIIYQNNFKFSNVGIKFCKKSFIKGKIVKYILDYITQKYIFINKLKEPKF